MDSPIKVLNVNRREFLDSRTFESSGATDEQLPRALGLLLLSVREQRETPLIGLWCGDRIKIIELATEPGLYEAASVGHGWHDVSSAMIDVMQRGL